MIAVSLDVSVIDIVIPEIVAVEIGFTMLAILNPADAVEEIVDVYRLDTLIVPTLLASFVTEHEGLVTMFVVAFVHVIVPEKYG